MWYGILSLLLFLGGVVGLSGCRLRGDVDAHPFVILIEARASDFRPVEGLVVLAPTGSELGRTNADGRVLISATGREGESVDFLVQPPPGMLISEGGDRRRVLLKRLRSITGGYSSVNLIDHGVNLRKRKLTYAVLLATNKFAGLPVYVFGVEKTRLNSRGVGMFLHEGLPGDELTVTVLTDQNPRIVPVSPQKTFVLPESPTQLFWRTTLELRKVAEVKKVTKPKVIRHNLPRPI